MLDQQSCDKDIVKLLELTESNALYQLNYPFWGRHFVHIGSYIPAELFGKIAFHHHIPIHFSGVQQESDNLLEADLTQLPFGSSSVDVIMLQRVLELAADPIAVLAEASRVLNDKGVLVMTGLNRHSLWRLSQVFRRGVRYPWGSRFMSVANVRSRLRKLGLNLLTCETHLFEWPRRANYQHVPSPWVETLGAKLFPLSGGLYVLMAKKETIPLNPLLDKLGVRNLIPSPWLKQASPRRGS